MMPEQQAIHTDRANPPGGPYNQAVRWGQLVFTASVSGTRPGQAPPPRSDLAAQTANALANLQAILEAAGSSLAHTLHITAYLRDSADLAAMNEVYERHFTGVLPARSLVVVTGAKMPVAFDAIAYVAAGDD
jgi:2-iminobutanoate/2-iminopropanoate deaminase